MTDHHKPAAGTGLRAMLHLMEANPGVAEGVAAKCPRCGHEPAVHWPAHDRPTTACLTCLDAQNYTQDPTRSESAIGVCCYTVDYVETLKSE